MIINLRKITLEDQPMLMRWRQQPDVTRYMYTDPVLDMDHQLAWWHSVSQDPTRRQWIIQVDGVDIGFFNFYDIDRKNLHCGWGYYIAADGYQGKGIGKAVECSAYDYAFNELGMNKAWADVFDWNAKVIAIHLHMGCQLEAHFFDHIMKNDRHEGITRVCMLRSWWEAKKPEYTKAAFEYHKCTDCFNLVTEPNRHCVVFWDDVITENFAEETDCKYWNVKCRGSMDSSVWRE